MAQVTPTFGHPEAVEVVRTRAAEPAYIAYMILRIGFTVLPIVAGLDKFFDSLVNWDQYLAPTFAAMLGGNTHAIMMAIGGVEIVAGLLVAAAPQFGAYLVMLWLWGIIINLMMLPGHFDIALRDFGLSLGALSLGQLSRTYHHH